jgi:hypothetical protein
MQVDPSFVSTEANEPLEANVRRELKPKDGKTVKDLSGQEQGTVKA